MTFPVQSFLSFLQYFAVAGVLVVLFQAIYTRATPYHEASLIKANKSSAAITYTGALIGFVLPVASVIAHAASVLDLVIWGVIAGVVQLVVFRVVCLFYPGMTASIEANEVAPAVRLAGVSVAIGILNAACMT